MANRTTKISRYLMIAFVLTTVVLCVSAVFGGFTMVSAGIYNVISRMTPEEQLALEETQLLEEMDSTATNSPSETMPEVEVTSVTMTPTEEMVTDTAEPTYTAFVVDDEPTTTPTITLAPTDTPQPTATITLTPSPTMTLIPATLDPTSVAYPMFSEVQSLLEGGVVSTDNGAYYIIDDFESNWAQTDSYQKTYTGYDFTDFVLRADLTWQVAVPYQGADSGCGIIFHENEEGDHYLAVFTLGDRAILYHRMGGSLINLGASYRYEVDSELAQAQVMLAVEDNHIHIFVNGRELYSKQFVRLESGKMAFTVISGTSTDYGTRCEMRNIELWEIKK